jgi:serine/threonine protein kinase
MAPEVILKLNHTYCVDYYAIGVIGYEMITGKRPYMGRTKKEIRDDIVGR